MPPPRRLPSPPARRRRAAGARTALAALTLCAAAPAPAAAAPLIVPSGSFGSGARAQGFVEPTSLAVDDAGRVYVADAGAGRVEVFDSATGGNRYLLSIGAGRLARPVAVAVDNRQRVYVADAARHVVELYESASRRFAPRGTLGRPGQALGQFDVPAALTTDPNQRLFVVEQGNMRVSVFRPARRGGIVFQSAFGIAEPEPFVRPGAIARDSDGRLFVASDDPEGSVRAYDRRGRFIAHAGGRARPRSPRGVAVDRFDRMAVSDTGANRLLLFAPLPRGGGLLEAHSLDGFARPGPLAFAPGALLYVLAQGRIVRLRVDDADVDGVMDVGDNCLNLPNGNQADTDADRRGDACDSDDDGDGRADGDDRCSTEPAPERDADGCRDPASRFLVPRHGRRYPKAPARLTGRADGGVLGVARVEVAIARQAGPGTFPAPSARCAWLDVPRRTQSERPCGRPLWFGARGRESWRVELRGMRLPPGRYLVMVRARQRNGPLETLARPRRNVRAFTIG